VCELHSVPDMLRGLAGTIKQSFDHLDHAAYDVLLDGRGSTQLFWYYQLKDEAPKGTLRQRRPLFTEVLNRCDLRTSRPLNRKFTRTSPCGRSRPTRAGHWMPRPEPDLQKEEYGLRADQTVSEMVVEALARQAEALSEGPGHSFEDTFAEVLKTPAGRRLVELADGPHRHEKAAEWQAGLLADREARRPAHLCEGGGAEGRYSWLGHYVERTQGKDGGREEYRVVSGKRFAFLKG
jgi:hypothetical protein